MRTFLDKGVAAERPGQSGCRQPPGLRPIWIHRVAKAARRRSSSSIRPERSVLGMCSPRVTRSDHLGTVRRELRTKKISSEENRVVWLRERPLAALRTSGTPPARRGWGRPRAALAAEEGGGRLAPWRAEGVGLLSARVTEGLSPLDMGLTPPARLIRRPFSSHAKRPRMSHREPRGDSRRIIKRVIHRESDRGSIADHRGIARRVAERFPIIVGPRRRRDPWPSRHG